MIKSRLTIITLVIAAIAVGLAIALAAQISDNRQYQYKLEKAFAVKVQDPAKLGALEKFALAEWARHNSISPSAALEGRRTILTSNGQKQCVVLALEPGAIGGSPMYCFNKDGVLIEKFDQVE